MSDEIIKTAIGVVPALLTGVAAVITSISLLVGLRKANRKIDEYHTEVNSKLEKFMTVSGNAREAEGKEKERIRQQRERDEKHERERG